MNPSNLAFSFHRLWLLAFACTVLQVEAVPRAKASPNIQSSLPVTLSGTWQAPTCRRGEGGEGIFTLEISARRRVSGWFTNTAHENVWPVRGQISRGGVVTARVKDGLRLRGVVSGTTNPALQGIILNRCVGVFESFPPLPPETNCCVVPTNMPALFPDTNLAVFISQELQKPVDQITPGDLAALQQIHVYSPGGVRDLTGLQHATNLFLVNVMGNPITNYSALYQLPKLEYLYLSHLTNSVFVTNFTQVSRLAVRYSSFDDANLILAMPQLLSLDLYQTRFPAIAALASNVSLTVLEHGDGGVTNLAPYGALTQLRILSLSGNPVGSVAPLATLTNLTSIYLGGYPLTDFAAGLSPLRNLNFALLDGVGLQDLDWLNATNINILYVRNNLLTNISRLAGLSQLYTLDLSRNPLSSVDPLAQVPGLNSLLLDEVGLTNLSFASGLPYLSRLHANNNAVSDLAPLATCSNLMSLELYRNQISELTPLAACTDLTYLSLHSNHIASLSGLENSRRLQHLKLGGNSISDLSPLTNLTALTSLDLSFNQITNVAVLASASSLFDVNLDSNQITDISPLVGLTNLSYVSLYQNPLDLTPGSAALHVVETLRSNGVWVGVSP